MGAYTFSLYKASDGSPYSGKAGNLTWYSFVDVATGSVTGPTITELASGSGVYALTLATETQCGIVNCSAISDPATTTPYLFVAPSSGNVFPAFAASTGSPVSGLTPTWNGSGPWIIPGGASVSPAPTITEVATSAIYVVSGLPDSAAGRVDLGSDQSPEYLDLGTDGGPYAVPGPSITNPAPNPLTAPIVSTQPLQFTVSDPGDPVASDMQVTITAQVPGSGPQLVYSPLTGFTSAYAAGSSAAATVPGQWTIAAAGGWGGSPTLSVQVIDANGAKTSAAWTWTVLPAAAPVFSTVQSQPTNAQLQYPYGQDVSTFTKGPWGGPGLNPLGIAISTAQLTLAEAAARRLQTDHGALMWDQTPGAQPVVIGEIPFDDPDYGFNLRQFVNASLSQQQTSAIQSAIQNEVCKDERITDAAASVTLSGDPNAATLAVTLNLTPADPTVQPFLLVLTQSQFGLAINQISPVGN